MQSPSHLTSYPITYYDTVPTINPLPQLSVSTSIPDSGPEFLSRLPKDVLYTVAHFLPYPDILNLCRINKYFRDICKNPGFWKFLIEQRFPNYWKPPYLGQSSDYMLKFTFSAIDKYQVELHLDPDIEYTYETYYIDNLTPLFDIFELVENDCYYKDDTVKKLGLGYPNVGITRGNKFGYIYRSNFREKRNQLGLKSYLLFLQPNEFVDVLSYIKSGYYVTYILPDVNCLYITKTSKLQTIFLNMLRYIPKYISECGFGYVIYEPVIFPTSNVDTPAVLSKQYSVSPDRIIKRSYITIFDYDNIYIYQSNNPDDIYWTYGITPKINI